MSCTYICSKGGGGAQIFFIIQDLKICASVLFSTIIFLCYVRGLCKKKFHSLWAKT